LGCPQIYESIEEWLWLLTFESPMRGTAAAHAAQYTHAVWNESLVVMGRIKMRSVYKKYGVVVLIVPPIIVKPIDSSGYH
jgi:hypothetical protein